MNTETTAALNLDEALGIGNIKDTFTGEFEVLNPNTNEGTGLFLTIAGAEHPLRKAIVKKATQEARAEMARRMASRVPLPPNFKDPDQEELESRQMLASITLGWRSTKVQLPPFSQEGIAALYADPTKQWLVKQVARRVDDESLFIKA